MSLFAKAKERAKAEPKAAKKSTTWLVGDPDGATVGASVKELVQLSGEQKALDARMGIHKQIVARHAFASFVRDFATSGVLPDTPMKVVNSDGDSVTYVVQDRGGQYNLKEEQIDALNQILGEDVVADLLYTQHTIGFNRAVMALPGVSEAIEKALESSVKKMLKDGLISPENADELITVDTKTALKPQTLDRAAELVGKDQTRLAAMIQALGSSCCTYIKC